MSDRSKAILLKYRQSPKGVLTNMYDHMKRRHIVTLTLREFHDMFLDDQKYLRLHDEWVKSGFQTNKKPSVDRINPNLGYKKSNLQMLTWEENRYKQRMELKRDRGRHIFQFKNGKLVKKYISQRHAVKETGFSQSMLSQCLNGKCKTGYGYQWSYENPELLELTND